MYPLKFKPIYKEKIWGGRKFESVLSRPLPSGRVGESWDIACHPNGMSIIENGLYSGETLADISEKFPRELFGKHHNQKRKTIFPLLVKIIDANDDLSVQVHPDDSYANKHETGELGKTEMWYVLAAEPNARIIYGLKNGVTKEILEKAIYQGTIVDCLKEVQVKPGDVFTIPAGVVHALGEGVMVVEIQQNSDTTYRLYDWARRDDEGKSRELHVEKALDVIDLNENLRKTEDGQYNPIGCTEYFVVNKLFTDRHTEFALENRFHILINLNKEVFIIANNETISLRFGESCLLPAEVEYYTVYGDTDLLQVYLP